jgi:hypothetical protein
LINLALTRQPPRGFWDQKEDNCGGTDHRPLASVSEVLYQINSLT